MSDEELAIRVAAVSKCYTLYNRPEDRLKQSIVPRLQRLAGRSPRKYYSEFWALRDVSFEVARGETVGIIGRNGSGKSTLLQIICGTLAATGGSVVTRGRIAALLELGSGFNPEFTGRENVYMNGAILGLGRNEMDARFDAIAAFADIGDFIEQPLKTYSSGMSLRLAFAVIAHVDADILIIDEALAVGDAFFTQKCMMHIKKLQASGVTILFVSHDTNAVKGLCSNALLLEHGTLSCFGATNAVVEAYYGNFIQEQQSIIPHCSNDNIQPKTVNSLLINKAAFDARANFRRLRNGKADFLNIQMFSEGGQEVQEVNFGSVVIVRMVVRSNCALPLLGAAYHVRDKNGFDLVYSDTAVERCPLSNPQSGEQYIIDWKFKVSLRQGDYTIAAMLSIPLNLCVGEVEVCDFVPIAVQFKVARGNSLPIYGAIHWDNNVTCRSVGSTPLEDTSAW